MLMLDFFSCGSNGSSLLLLDAELGGVVGVVGVEGEGAVTDSAAGEAEIAVEDELGLEDINLGFAE